MCFLALAGCDAFCGFDDVPGKKRTKVPCFLGNWIEIAGFWKLTATCFPGK